MPVLWDGVILKKTFIDMLFSYIINDINEYGDLTVQPALNLDYCLLIVKLTPIDDVLHMESNDTYPSFFHDNPLVSL